MEAYTFSISRQDLRLADKKVRQRLRKITPKKYVIGNYLSGVLLWLPVGFGWAYTKQNYGMSAFLVLLGAVACAVLSWKVVSYLSVVNVAEFQDSERKDSIHASMEISDTMLKLTVDGNTTEMKKDEISEIENSAEFGFLYVGPLFCYVFPKSGFAVANEYEEITQQLQGGT